MWVGISLYVHISKTKYINLLFLKMHYAVRVNQNLLYYIIGLGLTAKSTYILWICLSIILCILVSTYGYIIYVYFQTIGKTNNISQEEGPLLEGIHQALLRESITTEIMVGLLTLLCVLLTTLVVYLCYTRGIASLSRYVM